MPPRELHVSRRPAPPKRRGVHDVILQQRESMQKFEAGGGTHGRVVYIGTAHPAQVNKRRP